MGTSIALTAGVRKNLLSLQRTAQLIGVTQNRLSTGFKVGSAVDDASAFFEAKSLRDDSSDFTTVKNNIDQAVSTISVAVDAIEAVQDIVAQMKGLAQSVKGGTTSERSSAATQFNTLRTQVDNLLNDATYNGINLVGASPDTLTVEFDPDGGSTLSVTGVDLRAQATSGLCIAGAVGSWATDGNIDAAITDLDNALSTLRSNASTFGSNLALATTRLEFTNNLINDFEEGADKLTLADVNEEGANLLALQTRQQLGINALALASQSESAVLSLF